MNKREIDHHFEMARHRLITHYGAVIVSNRKDDLHSLLFREGHHMANKDLRALITEALKWADTVVKITGEPP